MPPKYVYQNRVERLNRDSYLKGLRGYPDDKSYMKTVGKAALEKSDNAAIETADDYQGSHPKTNRKVVSGLKTAIPKRNAIKVITTKQSNGKQ
jgi:hypothetical protein